MPCTRHRVFLATLIVAAKYLNDSSPKNKNWVNYARLFELAEVNLMEKQLLYLLDYDLRFTEEEALHYFAPFLPQAGSISQEAATEAAAKEARAAAVTRAKARVQATEGSAPVLPSPATSISSVQSFVKRLSTQYLNVPTLDKQDAKPKASLSRVSSSSTLCSARSHSEDSEASLTCSSGSSSPSSVASSDGAGSGSDREYDIEVRNATSTTTDKRQSKILAPAYMCRHRQGRKVSTASTCTVKGEPAMACAAHEVKRLTLHLGSPERSNSYSSSESSSPSTSPSQAVRQPLLHGRGRGIPVRATTYSSEESRSGSVVSSATMPSMTRTTTSGSFLSRMWAATKGQIAEKDSVTAAEQEGLGHGPSNAFRRLAHSKSAAALFRGQQQQPHHVEM